MKSCPSCGEETLAHIKGEWRCINCDFSHGPIKRSRTKRYLERIDRIGARLANVRW